MTSDTPRLPELFVPVDVIQRGTGDALTGGGMYKLVIGIVDADVQAAFA